MSYYTHRLAAQSARGRDAAFVPSAAGDLWPHVATAPAHDGGSVEKVSLPIGQERTFFSYPGIDRVDAILLQMGYRRAPKHQATFLFYKGKGKIEWSTLRPWQRVSHLRTEGVVSHKGHMFERLIAWQDRMGATGLPFLPETYLLGTRRGRRQFLQATERGLDSAWILKIPWKDGGKGLTLIHTEAQLRDVRRQAAAEENHEDLVMQRYIKDPLLVDGRKFDLRVYWIVASINPEPILLYQDGSLRVSMLPFHDPLSPQAAADAQHEHFTNAAQQKSDQEYDKLKEDTRKTFRQLHAILRQQFPNHPVDPLDDVRCQIEQTLAIVWNSAQEDLTIRHEYPDAFSLMGADFTIDQNLHLWLTECQSGPGLPSNTAAANETVLGAVSEFFRTADEVMGLQRDGRWPSWPLRSLQTSEPFLHGRKYPRDVISPACVRIGRPTTAVLPRASLMHVTD